MCLLHEPQIGPQGDSPGAWSQSSPSTTTYVRATATPKRQLLSALLTLSSLTGCGEGVQHGEVSSVTHVKDIVLVEDSNTYIGRANGLLASRNGSFYVSDASRGLVHVIDRTGRTIGSIGRKGSGPGELNFPASLTMFGDSVLAVLDFAASRVAMFSVPDGAFRDFVKLPVRFWSLGSSADVLYGGIGFSTSGSVRGVSVRGAEEFAAGPIPALFQRVPATAAIFGQMEAFLSGDSLFTAFEVSDALHVTSLSTGAQDSVMLPVRRRRGVQHRLLDAIQEQDPWFFSS